MKVRVTLTATCNCDRASDILDYFKGLDVHSVFEPITEDIYDETGQEVTWTKTKRQAVKED